MTTITTKTRNTIRAILADSNEYDARTLRISRDGLVTARKDADKTYRTDSARYLVGYASDMVTASGDRREGW